MRKSETVFSLEKCESVVELTDEIEKLFESLPDKRKKKDYEDWKKLLNSYIKKVNELSKFKMYNLIK